MTNALDPEAKVITRDKLILALFWCTKIDVHLQPQELKREPNRQPNKLPPEDRQRRELFEPIASEFVRMFVPAQIDSTEAGKSQCKFEEEVLESKQF